MADEHKDMLNSLSQLVSLREKGEINEEDFSILKDQILRPLSNTLSDKIQQQQKQKSDYGVIISLRLQGIAKDLSQFIEILKDIKKNKIIKLDEKGETPYNDMMRQIDNIFHEIINSLLPFYTLLKNQNSYKQWDFEKIRDTFIQNPPKKGNIDMSCRAMSNDLYRLEHSKGLDRFPNVTNRLKDLGMQSNSFVIGDNIAKTIINNLSKDMSDALQLIGSRKDLDIILSSSNTHFKTLIDLHNNSLPCIQGTMYKI